MTDETLDLIKTLATPTLTLLGLVVGYLFSQRKTQSESQKLQAKA